MVERKWKHILTAGTLSLCLLIPSVSVLASDGIIKKGDYHIDQFGKYDILVNVEVKDNKISNVEVTGENFSGTYAKTNKQKLSQASEEMEEKFKGISVLDAEKIMGIDTVSGATVSSDGIKRAVLDALDLEEKSDTTGTLQKVPEAGEYEVSISAKSDIVEHSIVGNEKTTANLSVDENGKMQLSYRMVSGTEKEPMYILAFHGYYQNNDRAGSLTLENASMKTETKNGYTVVTDVTFPLYDLSGIYYANSRIYVPSMSNLNGLVSGVQFENGAFDVDNIITVYWDTLKRVSNNETKDMDITAMVEETIDSPTYSIKIPSALSMGNVSPSKDNVMEYEITIQRKDKDGKITVSAPESGELLKKEATRSAKNSLKFTNDFGKQTIDAEKEQTETNLKGKIYITAEDVKKAEAGTYNGTTVFTIAYENTTSDDKKENNSNSGGSNNKGNSSSLGNNTLGKNTLGSSKLGSSLGNNSSLKSGTSSLGSKTNSSQKLASNAKTNDTIQNSILWGVLFLLGGVALLTGIMKHKKGE